MEQVVVAWSGGKDAGYAFHLLEAKDIEIVELLTTFNEEHDRSTMHGVRTSLYRRQADAVGVSLNLVSLPPEPSNEEYEEIMGQELARYRSRGIRDIVFADIALEDVRSYREDQLDGTGIRGRWPLWKRDTTDLVGAFLDAGFRATVVSVHGEKLGPDYVGRQLDAEFLDDLPTGVDPCGENGEFHTFVWDGPIFERPVPVESTETVSRTAGDTEFHYADLRATSDTTPG